jgi:hypothetical protein
MRDKWARSDIINLLRLLVAIFICIITAVVAIPEILPLLPKPPGATPSTIPYDPTKVAPPTGTPVAIPASTENTPIHTPIPTPSSTLASEAASPSRNSCLPTEHEPLGNRWVSDDIFLPTEKGASRIFSHCPPMTTIEYDEIAVDDHIEKVELVCKNSTTDITGLFQSYEVEGKDLDYWQSSRITLESECRIDFTIRDTEGVNIGLVIEKSGP